MSMLFGAILEMAHRGIPECLEVGGDGEVVLGLPYIFK